MNKNDLIVSTQLGLQFALTLCLFTGAGYWVDKKLNSSPVFLIGLGFAGFAAGIYYVVKAAGRKVKEK